jgi:lysophospholipase L1-like esterase
LSLRLNPYLPKMKTCSVRRLGHIILLAAFSVSAALCRAEDSAALVTEIRPNAPLLRYNGRIDWQDPDAPCASFPGSELIVHFNGTALGARLSTTRFDEIQVVVDGVPTIVLKLTKDPALYVVAHDLRHGEHTVILFKRTERGRGNTRFLALKLPAGDYLLPAPPALRNMEFIGDSITCGYGDEAAGKDVPVSPDNSNQYVTYAAVAARLLGAEQVSVAVSGIRLTESPGKDSMPTVYRRTDPNMKEPLWDFSKGPMPDIVVIDLGTNDFRLNDVTEEQWKKSYAEFLDFIRAKRPGAHIFLADGPMMGPGEKLDNLRRWNQQVVDLRQAAGDLRVHVLHFDVQKASDGLGSDWHPSVKTHEITAEKLVAAVKAVVNW